MLDLLNPEEAAERLGICTRTLREHVRAGELAFIALGRGLKRQHRMFHPADLEAFIDDRRRRECPPMAQGATRRSEAVSSHRIIDFTALRAERRNTRRESPEANSTESRAKPGKRSKLSKGGGSDDGI